MPHYADLTSIAANMQDKAVLLRGDSIAFLLTALGEYLEHHFNWNGSGEFGILTDSESDDVDAIIARTERALMGNMTGLITQAPFQPEGTLFCDGTQYGRLDYPDLYAKLIDTVYIVDEDNFVVPNLNGKFPLGGLAYGEEGGEAQVTLGLLEMPSHIHATTVAEPMLIPVGLEAATTVGVPVFGYTSAEGGGEPHNNIPPFHTVGFFIWT